ncbi:MAG: PqqD family protein [Methylococcales bacterium]
MKNTLLASKRLAVSESGFVFDPVSGQSFSVNETGLVVLHLVQQEQDLDKLVEQLAEQFDASILEINRDVQDFINRLKGFLK